MFDIWIGDMNLTVLILIISVIVVLPVQLLLCFKVKNKIISCIPVIVLFAIAIIAVFQAISAAAWGSLLGIFGAIYAAIMIFMCGIGWGIWAIVNAIKKTDKKS